MNRIYRLVWSHRHDAWVVVAEIARGRGKSSGVTGSEARVGGAAAATVTGEGAGRWRERLLGAALLTLGMNAFAAPPAAGQLPTGGNVVAGQAAISQSGARMDINQASNRAVIDWSSYNVGAAAQVNYNQPSAASATLNRVMDTQASQILGKITANGQVVLVNPNGVYFGKGSSVDVGGLVASTHDVANADFMAGKSSFARNGSTGSVVNEGELRAALGGYIALLAPEVRNEGVIVARMGTVALASGERVTLQFDGNNSLAGIVVEPSKIKALVENKGAVVAPGGVIILSARAVDRLQGGIVRNSGKLEATGMAMKGGKIVLEASDRVENTGTVSADAGRDGSPAGEVSVTAPVVVNSGTISAKGAAATEPVVAGASRSGGRITVTADTVTQTATGKLDVSGADKGGEVTVKAAQDVAVSGTVDATAEAGEGGAVHVEAGNNITLSAATMDVSGVLAGGQIRLVGGQRKAPTAPADNTPPTTAILDSSSLRAGSRRGRGGSITLTGDHVGLFEGTELDASGATGGGTVLVGGDYQGKNPDIANAQATFVADGAVIRADATDTGNGGKVIVWADGNTRFLGQISARGGANGGDGGFAEVSGKGVLDFRGQVDLLASAGRAGTLLLDPYNLTISSGADTIASGFDADGDDSVLNVATLQNALANGNVTVTTGSGGSQAGNITVASTLGWFSNYSLTLTAANNITVNSGVSMIAAGNGNMILTATGGALSNAGTVRTYGGNLTVVAGGAVSGAGVYDVAGTASFTAGGNIDLTTATNRFVGAMSLATTSGSVQLVNSVATVLNGASATSGVSIASGGSITTGGSATGLDSGSGALTLTTASGSNGSISYTGSVHAGGDTSVSADGLGAISLAHITGAVKVVSASAGGAITFGDSSTGAVTLDSASGNVISGTAGSAGQASGTVSVTGTSITLNDPIRTKGGRVNLTATSGDVTALAGANIVTTADGDTGTASGVVSVTAQGNVTLQAITTTGANNLLGVGSNAAAVGITATTGDVNVGAITTSGGDATPEASNPTNRNGGNAGNIIIGAPGTGKKIYLNGDLLAIGGGYSGASTQGLGGYIELQTPTILTANRLVSTGATSGNIYALSTIDSDGTARSLTLTAGTGDVRLRGVVGGAAPLSSFTVSSSANTTVEKNLTTNAAGGVTINASYNIHLGDDTVANGSGAMTVDTRTGNGTVTLNTINTWLDDAVTFTRGSGAISVAQNLYSKAAERNDLTFNGTGGGAISVGWDVGGGSVGGANSLGDILVSTGTDLSLNRNVSAKSLVAVNSTGRLLINGSNIYAQYYDGASGLQLQTTGSANNVAGDENVTVYGSVTSTASGAPISIAAPNGTLTLANYADLTTAAGAITLSASGNISNGYDTDLTSTGGAITVSSSAGALNLTGDYLDITTTSGQVNLSGVGVTFGNTGAAGMASTVNAGSGKIRVNGGGGRIQSYGTLTSTDADTAGTSAILLQNAYVASASSGAVVVRAATATGGTLEIGQLSGGLTASNADVRGDVLQYDSGASYSDTINIKTLKVASTTTINVGDNSNIIDELGGVTLGGALTIQAKGRVTGMALTGDVTATGVDIRTGVGALAVGTRNITATTGNVVLRGRGITQSAGSTISSTSGTVTLYGSDYATNTLGDVTLAGTVNAGSNSSAAVTIDDTAAVQLGDITAGVAGNRGGLVLGSNTYQSLNGSGGHWLYANGAVSQAANTAVKVGVIQAFQLGGPLNLSNVTNEIGQVGYVRRGGAITLYDKDAEGNGLLLTNIYDGSYDTLLTATTEGAMTLSGTNRGKGMVLTAGAGGFSASGSIEGHHGGAGKITITTSGGVNLTGGTMYAKGIEIYSGAAGIINSVDLQAHHGGGDDLILDAGGGNVTLNNRLYISGSGNDIFIRNANNVQLNNIELHGGSKLVLGGVGTGVAGADVPLTGNVTQTSRIYSDSDTTDLSGAVSGSVNLNGNNEIYRLGYFATGGNFNLYDINRNLTVVGAVSSATGNVSISNGNYGITLASAGSLTANTATKSVSVGGYGGNTNGWVNIQGAISAGTGGIALTGGGNITNNSTGTLTTGGSAMMRSVYGSLTLGGDISAGANGIQLTSGGTITQTAGVLTTPGAVSGPDQSGGTSPTYANPSALGAISLTGNNVIGSVGPFYLNNASSGAFSLNDTTGGLTLTGPIKTSTGNVTLTTNGGALNLATYGISAGEYASGGANIALTGRGIIQAAGSINATGGSVGTGPSTGTSGGTITLTGHDGTAAGDIVLSGTVQTASASASASAVTIRGTSALALPNISAPNGGLVLGDSTPTIGAITGAITQSATTSVDVKTLNVTGGSSAVLANTGNKIFQLGAISVGDNAAVQYDFDAYDSTSGLSLTQSITSAGGLRLRTATGDGASGALAIGVRSITAHGDVFLGGDSVTQSLGSVIDADSGSIRVDGGSNAFNISLLGTTQTASTAGTAIEIVGATNATLNVVSATAGTVTLGVTGKELTGTVAQVADTGTLSAATLAGKAGVVTLNKTYLDNLGSFITTGALTLKDLGGAGTAGLKLTGNVVAGAASSIETTDGVLDLDTHSVDATGVDMVLKGVAVSQTTGSSIKSTTASIFGNTGNITLDSALNDFTGQVTVTSTGSQVSIRDANQLSMNALTGKLAQSTSITAIAGTQLVLATENLTTTTGNIEFRSLDGNLTTPGTLTTGSGSVSLYATTSTPGSATNGNVQVNQTITTGSGSVNVVAQKEVNLSKSVISTSGNLLLSGDTITHSTGSAGAPLMLQTGGAGTIDVTASGTGGFVMGQYYSYQAGTGTISITSGSTADLANISSSGAVTVDAVGLVQQVGAGATIASDSLAVTTANNGSITLTNATNDVAKLSLRSRNAGGAAAGSGTITYNDANGFAVRQIETTGAATLTAHGAISTDSSGFPGTVVADTLTVKSLSNSGADIILNAAGNDVNSLTVKVRDAADAAIAGSTSTPSGTIRFTDADGFSVTSVETLGSTVLSSAGPVTQTGAILSAKLGLQGSGSYTLNAANTGVPLNEVSTFASDATGAVNLSSKLALTIGSVNPTGITTGGASISLSAPGIDSAGQTIDTRSATPGTAGGSVSLTTTATGSTGNLRTGNIITSGSDADIGLGGAGGDAGNITLTTAGDTLTVAGTITARGGAGDGAGAIGNSGTVRLNAAAGAVSQADGSNEINAGKLLVNAAKASSLLDTTNAVDLVAARITGVGEGFTYRSGADYAVGGGDGVVTGISTQGGAIDLGSSPVAVTVSEAVTTRGGSFSATGVGSFDSSSVAISTLGDITYAAGAYQNGGAIHVATTASGGNVHTGTLITSGSAGASGASAGSVTLNADGVLTTSTITALGQGTGTGGAVDLTGGSGVHLAGSIDTSGGVAASAAAGGNISITGAAQVTGGDRVLSTGAGSGDVVFNGSLDADGTPRGLTVSVGTGNATFSSAVGGTSPLGALVVNSAGTTRFDGAVSAASVTTDEPGSTLLNGNVTTTSGAQVYHDIVEVRSGITLGTANGAVTFDKTVDSQTGETNALTVSTGSGNVTFTDVVGGTTALGAVTVNSTGTTKFNAAVTAASVATNAGGTTQINGNITTTGTQTYNDAVELQAPLAFATTNSAVTFGGTVDSQVTGGVGEANPLTVNAGSGDVSFMGVVGGAVKGAPGAIVVNSSGTTLFNAAVTAASVTTDAPGKTQLGGNITTTGAQHFQDDVEVLTGVSLATTNSAVTFDKAVDSAAGQTAALTVGSGSADVTFSGLVGGTTALGALAVDSTGTTLFADAVHAASVTTNVGGTTRLGGNVTTSGAQTYNDAVELLTGVTVTTTNSAVSFGGTLNSEAGEGNNLTVVAGSGDVGFTGAVGGAANGRLGTLTVTSAHDVTANAISAGALVQTAGSGTTTLNGAVDTDTAAGVSLAGTHLAVNAGITTTNAGGVTLNQSGTTALSASGDINADGAVHITAGGGISTAGDIITNGADVTFASATTLTGPVSINTGGGTSTIQFASTVDSDAAGTPRTLRLATGSGGLNFVAALGGTHALDELRLESAGVITQSGGAPIKAAKLAIKSAGNVTLTNTGNDVDVLAALLSGGASLAFVDQDGVEVGTVDTAALQIVGITNTAGSSNVSLTLGGPLTQAVGSPILIGGNLTLDTSAYEAADVAVKNVHAAGTVLDDSLIAGAFTLDSTGAVTQKAGTPPAEDAFLQVGGSFDLVGAGQFSSGNSSKNLIGGGSAAVSGNEIRLFGVITLSMSGTTLQASAFNGVTTSTASVAGAKLASGLQVVSDAGGKTISAVAGGNAIVLGDSNNIGGLLKITTKGTFSDSGSSGITGINQSGALDLGSVSLIVQQSAANAGSAVSGAGALNLANAGNQFSGSVAATAVGMNATLNASGDLALGSVTAANLAVGSTGNLTQAANTAVRVGTLAITGAQSVTLDNANRIGTVAASSVSGALSLANAQTLAVGTAGGIDGITASGPVTLRTTSGDIVLDKGITVSGASDITLASAANFTNHAGAAALTVDAGHWQVWSTDPAADTLGGLAPDLKQYDATYGTTSVLGTGNGLLYTLAPELSVALTGSVERVYDSTTAATLVQGNYNVTAGLVGSDAVVFGTVGSFDDKNVGSAKKVSVSPVIDSASAGSIVVYGYKLASGSTAIDANIGKITKATLSAVTGITASDKTYDGNDSATLATGSAGFTGKYAGDVLAVDTATGHFASKNASATSGTVNITGITLTGTDAGNYALADTTASTTATINPYAVSLTGSRVYNGTTVVGTGDLTLGTLVGSETLTLSGAGSVATRHVGTGKTVDVSGLSLVGDGTAGAGLASNYTFVGGTQTVNVTKANLSVTTSDVTKTYDGSLAASGTAVVAAGGTQLFGGDTLSGGTFAFTNANAGTNKTVNTSAVTVNDGNSGGNYTVSYVANTTSTIDKATITVSTSNVTKTYDGTLSAAGTAVVTSGTLFNNASNGGALDNLSGGSFAFTNANAGTGNKTVTVGGVTVNDGASGGNYTVTYASNTTSTINKAAITVGTSDVTKAYDGGLSANGTPVVLSGTLYSNASNGGALDSLSGGTYAFTDKNAGSGKTVTVGGVTVNDGASGGNYAVTYASNTTSTIDRAQLTVVADVADRTYDGTINATLNGMSLVGLVGSETVIPVSAGTPRFVDKSAGTGKTVTITGIGLLDGINGGVATNYQVASTATGTASIARANVNVVGVVAMDKVYDGTTTATINTSVAGLTGVIGADDVSIGTITGSFDTKNVGTNKLVNGSAFVLSGADGGNYNLIQPTGMHASITPRALTVSATGVDKVYDGTTTATVSLADNRVNGDVLTLGYTANFLDKNVGLNKYVGVSGISLSGTDAGNYTANTTTAAFANISKATLNVSAAGINKAYDGTAAASVTLSDNRASGDSLAVSYTGAAFSDANGGLGKTVTVNGISVTGADIGNYTFNTTAITTADILGRLLTISGVQALGKVYDGTTAAVLGTGGAVLSGLLDGDVVSVGLGSGVFADKNAGTGKAVTVTGIALSGANAGSYTLQLPVGLTADITPASLTAVTGITAASKVYDGNVAAALNTGAAGFSGKLAGDVLSVASASGVFADKNAGTGKTVTIGNVVLGGADASNYVFTGTATTTADITPKAITVSGITASNKVYDATTAATLNTGAASFSGLVGSDSVGVSGTGQFADKNVGTAKPVAITSLVLDGADAGNYTVTTRAAPTADITPRALTAGGISAASKVYDGTTAATLDTAAGRLTSGVQGADDVSLVATGATGSFASKHVGVAKAVTVSGLALGGVDAGNYTIGDAAAFADITAKALTASGIVAANKVYDGTRVASLDTGAAVLAGVVMGDTVGIDASGVTGSFANKQAGNAKAVTIAGLGLTGADAGNYTVSDLSGATADVAARALTVAASTTGKLYDGSTSAPVSLSDNRLAGDLLNLSYTSASFDTAEVGLGKPIQVQGIALAGADAGNYRLVATTASTTGNISALDSVVPPPPVPATPVTTYTPVQPQAQVFDSALPGTGGSTGVVGGSGGVSGGLAGGSASSGLTGATGGGLGGAGGGLGGSGTASSGLGSVGSGGIASGAGIGSGSGTAGSGGVQAGAPATAGSGGVSGAVSAPAAGSGSGASAAVASEGSQSGVNVQLLQAPAATQTGLVRVSIPRGESTFVFNVPKDVYAGEGQSALAASTIRMENGSPVPAWIKHDPQSMSVSATNVPPGGLPVRLLLTIGGKVTTVVIGTTDQGGQ
ncbi:YDG domain-containing protein [uncultured Zoogloea sp.]|uniref:YDG domain-containing protein n=1 Tax=uncultured Zoogloea sp. TaxID=160237 RepID=UPI00261C5453|nr:YDG domain-containing protein [uncultured Zoogloea sp.]